MARLVVLSCFFTAQTWALRSDVWTRAAEPGNCEVYIVEAGDTCMSIARNANATYAQIVAWNDDIDLACSNLGELQGDEICISNPLGDYVLPVNPVNSQGISAIITTTALFLNPHVWENCTNVYAEYYYCVRPVGYLSTYPGYPSPTSTREFIHTPTTDVPCGPTIPIAKGTRRDCWRQPRRGLLVVGHHPRDHCGANIYAYPCTIAPSSSYCVALSSPTPAPPPPPAAPSSPRAAGESENCTRWFRAASFHTCETVLMRTRLSIDEFYTMNPSVNSDCSGMALGTYYCISTHHQGLTPSEVEEDENDRIRSRLRQPAR
ncbi:carbohydrate-binding module family 50 protein [Sodiomyces alcalophilus JCM 7366]|uniref:carbohydrate-binding module family 50 protein n=1 Tax=Sodiomyces alcalophilus JCM 7366 TaxID=591952 RepID=UPI0039B56945